MFQDCQKKAWKADHSEECKMLKKETDMPNSLTLFLSRLFRKVLRENGEGPNIKRNENELISIVELESNYEKLTIGQQENMGLGTNIQSRQSRRKA